MRSTPKYLYPTTPRTYFSIEYSSRFMERARGLCSCNRLRGMEFDKGWWGGGGMVGLKKLFHRSEPEFFNF